MAAPVQEVTDARGDEQRHPRSSHAAGLCHRRASLSEKLILQPAQSKKSEKYVMNYRKLRQIACTLKTQPNVEVWATAGSPEMRQS